MKNLTVILTAVLVLAATTVINAQNDSKEAKHNLNIGISTHALVDVESDAANGTTIDLAPTAPTEAGLGLDFTNISNSDLWLNYSSIVTKGKTNSVSVAITGDLPSGVSVELEVGEDQGKGKGKKVKVVSGTTELGNGDKIIEDIKSCYTGTGTQAGHNLTYSLKLDEDKYEDIVAQSFPIEVTYTITEN